MKALADYIHSRGFKAGIYSSPGPSVTNDEVYVGSYQHEAEDARRFAAWGYDFLKYDWCSYEDVAGGKDLAHLKKPYELMQGELRKLDRDIVLNLCQYGMGDVWTWGASCGNSWRTAGDLGEPFQDIPNRSSATASSSTPSGNCTSTPGPAAGTIPITCSWAISVARTAPGGRRSRPTSNTPTSPFGRSWPPR